MQTIGLCHTNIYWHRHKQCSHSNYRDGQIATRVNMCVCVWAFRKAIGHVHNQERPQLSLIVMWSAAIVIINSPVNSHSLTQLLPHSRIRCMRLVSQRRFSLLYICGIIIHTHRQYTDFCVVYRFEREMLEKEKLFPALCHSTGNKIAFIGLGDQRSGRFMALTAIVIIWSVLIMHLL